MNRLLCWHSNNKLYFMTWICSGYKTRSDWLIPGYYSPVMPAGRLRAYNKQAKSQIINYSLTSNVQSLQVSLKLVA